MKRRQPEPGAWQVDEQGRWFRMIGVVKEYAPELRTVKSGSAPMSFEDYQELQAHNAEVRAENERIRFGRNKG